MFVEQISVFVENKTGRLADVMALLGREGVDVNHAASESAGGYAGGGSG